MKPYYLISLALLLMLCTFSACDWFGSADDIAFDAELPLTFYIDETADNPSGASYSDTELLDATSDPDVAQYKSKIKSFKVNRVTYRISGANPNTVIFTNGTLKVASSGQTLASAASVPLSNSAETDLTTDITGLNELAANLLGDKQELIMLQGTLSQTPVSFSVEFTFYVTIQADAL